MTWEEESLVERLIGLLRALTHPAQTSAAARRRSDWIRYFLVAWGARHWAERL